VWCPVEIADVIKHKGHIAGRVLGGESVGLAEELPAPEGTRYRTIRGIILLCVVYGLISVR
jgi:hypothetical protein